MLPNLPRFRHGQTVPAEAFNQIADWAEQFSQLSSNNDTNFIPSVMGGTMRNVDPRGFWARITNDRSGSKYGFQEITFFDDGSYVDQTPDAYGVVGSIASGVYALEIHGSVHIGAGCIVYLRPSRFQTFFTFDGCCCHATSGPSGPGGLVTVKFRAPLNLCDGTCILVEYTLTAPDITLGVNIDLPDDACGFPT